MANQRHVEILEMALEATVKDMGVWNRWLEAERDRDPDFTPDLSGAELSNNVFSGGDFSGVNLSGATLHGATFFKANLSGADLSGAQSSSTSFEEANLSGADLTEAFLRNANLTRAKLLGATLNDADLKKACLIRADLRAAKFSVLTEMEDANLGNATIDETTEGLTVPQLQEAKRGERIPLEKFSLNEAIAFVTDRDPETEVGDAEKDGPAQKPGGPEVGG